MPSAPAILSYQLDGGLDTERGTSGGFRIAGNDPAGGVVSVPWLLRANNIIYTRDGWFRKLPGATVVNATPTGSSDAVMGIFDYWRSTTSGSPTQQRIVSSGTSIYRESGGVLTSIKTPIEAGKPHCFEVMNDYLVIATTSTTDVPWTWDQTSFANLGGTPPNFSFHVQHKDRMWAAGVDANKSRLYYSAAGNQADWVGAGSGSIDVTPDDGDVITGLASHKNELIIFKGPNKGRILRLTGSSPTDFVMVPFVRGIGAISHRSIVAVNDDLMFWDDLGIHSLNSTAAYGDYVSAYLSDPIRSFILDGLNHTYFENIVGVNFQPAGYAMWTVATASASTNDLIVLYDYSVPGGPRFALWPAYAASTLSIVRDTSRVVTPWAGTYTGTVHRMNQANRDIGGTAYAPDVVMPYISFGDPFLDKMVSYGRVGFIPRGLTGPSVIWTRDAANPQTASIPFSGADFVTLAASDNEFILGTSVLGAARVAQAFFDMSGQFKELQIEVTQDAEVDADMEVHSLAFEVITTGIGTTGNLG